MDTDERIERQTRQQEGTIAPGKGYEQVAETASNCCPCDGGVPRIAKRADVIAGSYTRQRAR